MRCQESKVKKTARRYGLPNRKKGRERERERERKKERKKEKDFRVE